jgi:hypothetical protein
MNAHGQTDSYIILDLDIYEQLQKYCVYIVPIYYLAPQIVFDRMYYYYLLL